MSCLRITFCQTGVNHCRCFPDALRNRLTTLSAGVLYFLRHALRCKEAVRVCIYDGRNTLLCRTFADVGKAHIRCQLFPCGIDHPHSHNIFQITEPVIISALIRKIELLALSSTDSLFHFCSHQRPCTGTDIKYLILCRRDSHNCCSRVMCRRNDYLTGKSNLCGNLRCQTSKICTRKTNFLEQFSLIAQPIDEIPVPVLCLRIQKLCGGSVGILRHFLSTQQEMQIIRYHQKRFCLLHLFRCLLFYSHQLINRIKWLLLNTGTQIEFLFTDYFINFLIHSLCSVITISNCIPQTLILCIQKHKINRPGIHTDTLRNFSKFRTFFHSGDDLSKQLVHIPGKMPVLHFHSVSETVYFFQNHFACIPVSQDQPSAGSPDIHCKIIFHAILPSAIFLFCQSIQIDLHIFN